MADLETTIALVFEGVDRTGNTVTGIGRGLSDLEGKIGSVTGPLASLTGSIVRTEAAIVALGAAATGYAINEAGQFEDSIREIGTLFGATNEQVTGLGDEILQYADDSTASIEQINDSVYSAISTGTDYAEAVGLVKDAEVLATGGRADLAEVTALLTSSLNAYGESTQAAADFSDTLFTAVQTGNTTLPELASSLGRVTGIAASAGVPFADLNAAMSALTISAGNTAESSTLLRAVLTELIDPSDALKDALGNVTLESDGLEGVMARLQEVTGGEATAMSELFGSVRALQGALVLANDSSESFAGALEAQAERTGAAAAANAELSTSFESINQNLANNIRSTVIDLGDDLLETYGEIAQGLAGVFDGVGEGIDQGAFDDLLDGMVAAGEEATETLQGIADALPEALNGLDFDGFMDAFGDLAEEINGLFGDLDLTKAEDLETALQFIVDGIESLTRVSSGIVAGLNPFIELMGDFIERVNAGEQETKDLAGEILGLATGVNTLLPILGGLGTALTTVGGAMAVLGGARTLGATTTGLAGLASTIAGKTGVTAALTLAGTAGYGLGTALEDLTGIGSTLGGWIYDLTNDTDDLAGSMGRAATATDEASESGSEYVEGQQIAATVNRDANLTYEEMADRLERNAEIMATLPGATRDMAEAQEDVADSAGAARESLDLLTDAERENLSFQEQINLALERYAEQTGAVVSESGRLFNASKDLAGATDEQAAATERAARAQEDNAEQVLATLRANNDLAIEMERIASDERIRDMELGFELDLAKLEADAERAQSIIEGINETATATGDLIGGLFGTLQSETDRSNELDLQRQIDLENERREEALRLQGELVGEQVELLRQQARLAEARARAVANGDHLIQVEAEGLTPALEIVFDEILKFAQVRASQEGAEFLIGL